MEFVTPPPLESGDEVAVLAPSSGLAAEYPHVYERGLERLRTTFDLEPVSYPTATASSSTLAGDPAARARDLETAFADPDVRGVIATIGGNDQIRVLSHLDLDVLAENPTRFYGLSDSTNLALALWNRGIVSYYGGHLLTEFAFPGALPDYLEAGLRSALFDDALGEIEPAPRFTDQDLSWDDPSNLERRPEMEDNPGWRWAGGDESVTGRTWGGSLEIITLHLAADRYLPPPDALDGAVLVLETSEEQPAASMVRRSMQALGERGLLSRFDAILVGRAKARSHEREREPAEREAYRERQRSVIGQVVGRYNESAPIVFDLDVGHTNPVVPVPIGGRVTVDPATERVAFE
ncbi:MAG: S66 peptidase family protein [Halanaeroarchaeum sp.]